MPACLSKKADSNYWWFTRPEASAMLPSLTYAIQAVLTADVGVQLGHALLIALAPQPVGS
jgi:hypothetical protein